MKGKIMYWRVNKEECHWGVREEGGIAARWGLGIINASAQCLLMPFSLLLMMAKM
jgi:hypothetical protein